MNKRLTIYDIKTEKYILNLDYIITQEELIQKLGEFEQELEWQQNKIKEEDNNGIN